jgi:23S rRNA pseudouridine955/2504/2580 synthase
MKKVYTIKSDYAGTRLDRWLRKVIFDIPQSLIEKSIRKGNVKVNSKKQKSSYKIQENDVVTIFNSNFSPDKNKKKTLKYIPTKKDLNKHEGFFIEDNKNFVVINKPAGIAVQQGTKSRKNILDILSKTKAFEDAYPYPVHRIDKETTGILIVAKNRKFAQIFTLLFRKRLINKTYLGVVLGELDIKNGTLEDDLIDYEGIKKVKSKALTNFSVLSSNNNYSLIKLNPKTGRKHQLRKQLLIRGHPILGDNKYRIESKSKSTKISLMLHAYKINFSIENTKYKFMAELPESFKQVLKEKYLKNY